MLDAFLNTLVKQASNKKAEDRMVAAMEGLPMKDLQKLASGGTVKQAFGDDNDQCWLEGYEDTPLYDHAVSLQEELLNIEAARIAKRMNRPPEPVEEDLYAKEDMIRLKKRQLDLELSKYRHDEETKGEEPEEEIEEEEETPEEESEEPEEEAKEEHPAAPPAVAEKAAAARFIRALIKEGAELTEAARDKIKSKNFALSAKQSDTGEPKYPIEDKRHAANALTRVRQFGSSKEKSEVFKDVAKKYPEMAARSSVPAVAAKAKKEKESCASVSVKTAAAKMASFARMSLAPTASDTFDFAGRAMAHASYATKTARAHRTKTASAKGASDDESHGAKLAEEATTYSPEEKKRIGRAGLVGALTGGLGGLTQGAAHFTGKNDFDTAGVPAVLGGLGGLGAEGLQGGLRAGLGSTAGSIAGSRIGNLAAAVGQRALGEHSLSPYLPALGNAAGGALGGALGGGMGAQSAARYNISSEKNAPQREREQRHQQKVREEQKVKDLAHKRRLEMAKAVSTPESAGHHKALDILGALRPQASPSLNVTVTPKEASAFFSKIAGGKKGGTQPPPMPPAQPPQQQAAPQAPPQPPVIVAPPPPPPTLGDKMRASMQQRAVMGG